MNIEFIREIGPTRWVVRTFMRQFSKRILRCDNNIVLPNGLRMRLPRTSKFSTEVFVSQCNVDWGSEQLFALHLDPGRAVIDVGANVGYYSLYMLPRVASVHAFEPDSRARKTLERNLSGHSRAYVHPQAVGATCGTARFVLAESSEVSHVANANESSAVEIEMITIDRFVAENRLSVTGIKIDAEGADIDVLEGAKATLDSHLPLVLIETAPNQPLFQLVLPLNYRVFAFVKHLDTHSFHFQEIECDSRERTKMLFLVPPRLHATFAELIN